MRCRPKTILIKEYLLYRKIIRIASSFSKKDFDFSETRGSRVLLVLWFGWEPDAAFGRYGFGNSESLQRVWGALGRLLNSGKFPAPPFADVAWKHLVERCDEVFPGLLR